MIQTEIVTDLARIQPEQWEALLARCPDSTVFQTREWISSWWTSFARPDMQVHAIAAYGGGALVGLAPLYRTSRRSFGLQLTELRFLGEGPSDYNLFLVQDGAPEITDRLVAEMQRELRNDTAILLADVPQFSSLAFCLAPRRDARKVSDTPCPRLRLNGNSAGVAAILRKDSLRRHYKALSKIGPISARHHTTPESIKALLPELYRQHVARWSGSASPSLFLGAANRRFYESLAESLGREGKIIFTELRAGERLAALHFGLRSGNEFIWYKPAFDPDLMRQGPGEVLLKTLIELAQSNGYSAFDFSRGDESFKMRFATSVDHNATYEWMPRHLPHVVAGKMREFRREFSHRWKRVRYGRRETHGHMPPETNKRLLLLDLPASIAGRLMLRLKDEGFEVDGATTVSPSTDPRSSLGATSYDLPSNLDSAPSVIRTLDQRRRYALLIPFSEELVRCLSALPNDDPLRLKSLVPERLALSAADQQFPVTTREGHDPQTGNPRPKLWTVYCLCANGRLAWYRMADNKEDIGERSTWAAPHLARCILERLGWHGFAAITFGTGKDGRFAVKRFIPFYVPSETQLSPLARFIASAWAMTQVRRVPPQPRDLVR